MSLFENYKFNYGHSFLASAFGAAAGAAALTFAAPTLAVGFTAAAGGIVGSAISRAIYRGMFHNGESFGNNLMDDISSSSPQSMLGWAVWGDEYMAAAGFIMIASAIGYGTIGPIYDAGCYAYEKIRNINRPKPHM